MQAHTTKVIKLELEKPLPLKRGQFLNGLDVAYETYGELNATADNAVLICHALTMDAHVTNNGDENVQPGWWNFFVGPGKSIDTNKFFVVCFNVLGGCKGTTGPLSLHPTTGKPYLTGFPIITVEDMVSVQHLALAKLGVPRLHAVVGGSLGGMQALEWSVRYPGEVNRVIAMATGANLSPQGLAFDVIGRQSITNDPEWKQGLYSNEDVKNIMGLKLARMIGHITYISKNAMEFKFGRELQQGMTENIFNTRFSIESFLHYQADKFAQRFDPNSYLYLTKAMDLYDLKEGFESLTQSISRSNSSFLLLSYSSDWLFPPENSKDLAMALVHSGNRVSSVTIDTDMGHDAFLLETPDHIQDLLVEAFLGAET